MNRKESMEVSAYTAAIRMGGNAIMCDLMPGDEFTFPHSDVVHIARKNCWYHRKDSPSCVYRTGRLTAVLQLARN